MVDKQHVKGAIDKIKGTVKDTVGAATSNGRLQVEGKAEKAKGAIRGAIGDVKDALRKGI